jgi:hypothetical protein
MLVLVQVGNRRALTIVNDLPDVEALEDYDHTIAIIEPDNETADRLKFLYVQKCEGRTGYTHNYDIASKVFEHHCNMRGF